MTEQKTIPDLVVLGRAAPEPIQDGRETVCLGGYSRKEGYVRLYPTQRRMTELRRWNVVSVPVVHEPEHDNRAESYKIAGSRQDWNELHQKIERVDRLQRPQQIQLTHQLAVNCPSKLNDKEQSLGMVEPAAIEDYWLEETEGDTVQTDLSGETRMGKSDYDYKLYLQYRCQGCQAINPHEQHCIEWGIYKYWDNRDDYEGVFDALRLSDGGYKHYFFVGNLNHHRTAYIVISIIRFKKSELLETGIPIDEQHQLNSWA